MPSGSKKKSGFSPCGTLLLPFPKLLRTHLSLPLGNCTHAITPSLLGKNNLAGVSGNGGASRFLLYRQPAHNSCRGFVLQLSSLCSGCACASTEMLFCRTHAASRAFRTLCRAAVRRSVRRYEREPERIAPAKIGSNRLHKSSHFASSEPDSSHLIPSTSNKFAASRVY